MGEEDLPEEQEVGYDDVYITSPQTKQVQATVRKERSIRSSAEARAQRHVEVYGHCVDMAKALISAHLEKFDPEHVQQIWRNFIDQSRTNTMAALSGGVNTRQQRKDLKRVSPGQVGAGFQKKKKSKAGPIQVTEG